MLEFAPKSDVMSYEEALLYCQFLEHNGHQDWRMMTHEEWYNHSNINGWYLKDDANADWHRWHVFPVRDI